MSGIQTITGSGAVAAEGMLVSRRWLERVDQAVFGSSQSEVDGCKSASLFYDVRPARLQTAWTQNAAGVWVASACFIVNDVADDSFVFPVFAPTATASPGGTSETERLAAVASAEEEEETETPADAARMFVVWRGRWELLSGAGSDFAVAEPLVEAYENGVRTLRSGVFWSNKSGSQPWDDYVGALPNSCHVISGNGIKFVDGGECAHGAADGHILEIQATGAKAALRYGSFLTACAADYVNIQALTGSSTVSAITSLGEPTTTDVLSASDVETTPVLASVGSTTATVLTSLGTPTTDSATLLETPTTATVLASLGTPTTANAVAATSLVSQTVVTACGTPTTETIAVPGPSSSIAVLTGLGTPTTATIQTISSATTATVLAGLGTPTTDSFLQGTVGNPVQVLTGAQLALNGVAASSVQVLTGVECRDGGVYGIYSTLSITPTGVQITPISNASSATALTGLGTPTTASVIDAASLASTTVLTGLGTPTTANAVGASSLVSKTVVTGIGAPTTATINVPGSNSSVEVLTGLGTPTTASVCAPLSATNKTFLTGLGTPTTETLTVLSGSNSTVDAVTAVGTLSGTTVLTGLGTPTTENVLRSANVESVRVATNLSVTTGQAVTGYRED